MSTKSGLLSIACIQLGLRKLSIYRVAGCQLFSGCLIVKSELSVVLWVSAVEKCLLSRVPLYSFFYFGHIMVFEMLQCKASVKCGFNTHYINS